MKIQPEPMNRLRQLPLAACLMAVLGSPLAHAASAIGPPSPVHRADGATGPNAILPVTSCADDGSPDTLRSVAASAMSGDTIDLTQLTCSTITLASGAILVGVDDLDLEGPGADVLSIDGADVGRVLYHGGIGTLAISGLSITHGRNDAGAPPLGGCIYSKGTLDLAYSTVSACTNSGMTGKYALIGGAGVAAAGNLFLESSTLSGNTAAANGGPDVGTYTVVGGGAFTVGDATIVNSTISGNAANGPPGMNEYRAIGGGVVANGSLIVRNSTIAFNAAGSGAGGIFAAGNTIDLQSTIVANNTADPAAIYAADIGGYGTLTGANSLIVSSDLAVPADTLTGDPQLQPLAANGGPTLTHALVEGSPALDVGNNTVSLSFDQRGDGYARVSGLGTDIGAFEYQQTFGVPTVAKNFAPETIAVEETSTLTITLTNPNAAIATLSADLVDNLPALMVVADPADATTDCPSGMVTADPSAITVTLTAGAIIPASGACSVSVSVRSVAAGSRVNTIAADALQTDLGSYPNAASAELIVSAETPLLSKTFTPDTIAAGDVTMLTITLTNDNGVPARLTADLVDDLPPSLTVAEAPAAATTCLDATLAAGPGSTTVALGIGARIPPNATCTISVPITAPLAGIFTNTIPVAALATTLGSSPAAAIAELTVTDGPSDLIFADGFDVAAPAPNLTRLSGTR